jgi:hypothetical protein
VYVYVYVYRYVYVYVYVCQNKVGHLRKAREGRKAGRGKAKEARRVTVERLERPEVSELPREAKDRLINLY